MGWLIFTLVFCRWWIFTQWFKNSEFSNSDKVMNEWMKENKKMNERMSERMNERMNEWINEGMNKWINK